MLLHCSYEELRALQHGARALLQEAGEGRGVLAPPAEIERVEALLPRLEGDLSLEDLREQQEVETGMAAVVAWLREEMDAHIVATHAADEGAVSSYFDYAHALSVLDRVRRIGGEMRALIEVMTGRPLDERTDAGLHFPD